MVAIEVWWPKYLEIVAQFGYSIEEDQMAAEKLSSLLKGFSLPITTLAKIIAKKNILVCGAGPSLPLDLQEIRKTKLTESTVWIAADGATSALLENDITPHIIVTDLDGNIPDIIEAHIQGSVLAIHAHGDNIPALETHIPKLTKKTEKIAKFTHPKLIGTTQAQPLPNVINLGGFTDGDRGVFIAEALGASIIGMIGMNLGTIVGRYSKPHFTDDQPASSIKSKKLAIARQLLSWLSSITSIPIYNFTENALPIPGIPTIPLNQVSWKSLLNKI